jgi:hypothetical protein
MTDDFSTRFIGWSFLAAAILLWGGWMLMPVHIGTFFEPDDFARVRAGYYLWIWMYRMHLFGMVVTGIALVALASQLTISPARIMVWPGAAVALSGMIVGAVGAAFYYHHGAWGAQETPFMSVDAIAQFVAALRVDTEYVTCLVRFGRVFSGLGLVLMGCGLSRWRILPFPIGSGAVVIGLTSMGLTMLVPDQMALYVPVFHAMSLWLFATGLVILRRGLVLEAAP